ncbi:nucleoside monophosphate kinase [Patescibacteria group bacterium]|nr:nucleoside monophosphate kinase [Patescibacteria group bacterium]
MIESKESSYLLYGPPASGKTALALELSRRIAKEYISVGELTRREIELGTPRGKRLQRCLDEVTEYPIELITGLVEESIVACMSAGENFILDGFPKYAQEARAFVKLLEKHRILLDAAIVIDLPVEGAFVRVLNRRICVSCLAQTEDGGQICPQCGDALTIRDDDIPPIFKRRYNDYKDSIDETLRIIGPFCKRIIHIQGSQSKEDLFNLLYIKLSLSMPE